MKKFHLLITVVVAGAMWSCDSAEPMVDAQEQGAVMLGASFDSRSEFDLSPTELAATCNIYIVNSQGIIRQYKGVDQIIDPLWLASGEYQAIATAGDSVSASWDARYYKGVAPFTINTGEMTNVSVNCSLANVIASVGYDAQVKDALNNYTMRVGHARGWLEYEGDDQRQGFFMMPSGVTDLQWTLTATTFDGKPFTKTGVISGVKPATEYRVNIKYTGTVSPIGGAYLDINVDADVEVIDHNESIDDIPVVSLADGDINAPVNITKGEGKRLVLTTFAPAGLSEAKLSGDFDLLGLDEGVTFNLLALDENDKAALHSKGINVALSIAEDGAASLAVNFSQKLIGLLPANTYHFTLEVVDRNGYPAKGTLTIIVTDPNI